jgi:glycosyltransferase involved in cell wall biosynthesis
LILAQHSTAHSSLPSWRNDDASPEALTTGTAEVVPIFGTRALTVLIAVPSLDAGAADDGAIELVRLLRRAGHHSIVVSRGGRREDEVAAAGGEFICRNMESKNPLVMLSNGLALARIARKRGCDLVHAHGRAPGWSAYLAARLTRSPFLTTWYKGFREQNWAKRLYNSVMVRGEQVIVVSGQLADLVHRRYRLPQDRIAVIPRGIDFEDFDPEAVTASRIAAVRQAWGVDADTKVVLAVGRLLRRKGHHVVVEAMQRLKQRGVKNVVCVFIGEDLGRSSYVGELWDLVQATGTNDIIRTAGPTADLAAAYAAAAVVVSAAIQPEGLQRAILEAQAMARPVIISDAGAGADSVLAPPAVADDRMTGLRIAAGDPGELAAALVHLLSLPESARLAIGARGRAWVTGRFAPAATAEPLLRLYAEVAGRMAARRRSRR